MSVALLDVHYEDGGARAAVVFGAALDVASATLERVVTLAHVEPYEPGAFYRRELPCLRAALATLAEVPALLVVDGYVTLDAAGTPGLGAHLSRALGDVPVIGIAKTAYRGAGFAEAVLRGGSRAPLFVTAVGIDPKIAAASVARMHGPHRIPTLVRRVDQLARGLATPSP